MALSSWASFKCGGSPPSARTSSVFASDGKSIYLFGGLSGEDKLNDLYQLVMDGRPMWRSVQQKGDVPCPRDGHSFVYVPSTNIFYLFGGSDAEDKELNDLHTFDAVSGMWKEVKLGGAPSPRMCHAAAVLNGAIYIYGGFHDGAAVGDFYKFDTKTGKWSALPKGSNRCNHTMGAVGTNLYAFGGRAGAKTLFNDIYVFDTVAGKWETASAQGPEPLPRDFHSACVNGKALIIFGGYQDIGQPNPKYFGDVFSFDTEVSSWSAVLTSGSAPQPRQGHAAIVYGSQVCPKLLVFGGSNGEALELNDLFGLSLGGPAAPGPAAAAESDGAAPRKPAPNPARKPVVVPPPPPEPPAVKIEATAPPTINYNVPTPVPSARKIIEVPPIAPALPRDLDKSQRECSDMVTGLFRVLRDEFIVVDTARLEVNAHRDALNRERAENEALFNRQQAELVELHERHKKETEEWIAQRRKENDDERRRLAEEWASLRKDQESHKKEVEKLVADRAALEAKEKVFDEKSKKLEALMAQFKGIV